MIVLILGATSDIAQAIAHLHAAKGDHLILAGRKEELLKPIQSDLCIRYKATVDIQSFDARLIDQHQSFYHTLSPKPDLVYCVFGNLFDQKEAEQNWGVAVQMLEVNFLGATSILHHVAKDFEQRKRGTIVGISSVAGDRGRGSNYYYGSAKAGFTAYLSGLRNRLSQSDVHVLTVKPGYVRTAMTQGMELPAPLTAEPQAVAKAIFRAVEKKKNVLYVKGIWRWIMWVIRMIPESIFKRLSL
ncbi:MAG: SDR family oxidoreductase [Bacteroidota bacterium]